MKNLRISLAAARVNARMTQRDVAKALKVSCNSIVNWEKGISEPSYATVKALCDLYGLSIDNIFLPEKVTKS